MTTMTEYVIYICSGEGTVGTVEPYDGAPTVAAIEARLDAERCGGDRWAHALVAWGGDLTRMERVDLPSDRALLAEALASHVTEPSE